MSYGEVYIAERTMSRRVHDRRQEEGTRRLAARMRKQRFYGGALAWLGNRLVTWGEGLEERYSAGTTVTAPRSANHPAS